MGAGTGGPPLTLIPAANTDGVDRPVPFGLFWPCSAIALVVAAPVDDTAGGGTVPGLTEVIQGGETPSAPILWGVVLLAGLVVGGIAVGLPLYRRRRRTTTRGS